MNTGHDERHDALEQRLRTVLHERADDVEPTPELYRRTQRDLDRAERRPLWLGGAGLVAAAAVGALVLTNLPEAPLRPDVLPAPEDTAPAPTASDEPSDEEVAPTDVAVDTAAGTATAVDGRLVLRDAAGSVVRTVASDGTWLSVTVAPRWNEADGLVAGVLERPVDGQDGATETVLVVVDQLDGDGGDEGEAVATTAVDANGGQVVFSADGAALAWISGADLHILPVRSDPAGERVQPLELGDRPPSSPVLEQWLDFDAPVMLVSDADGPGLWSAPMDASDVFNTGPTTPMFRLDGTETAVDGLILPDLRLVTLDPGDGSGAAIRTVDGRPVLELPGFDIDASSTVTSSHGDTVAVRGTDGGLLVQLVDGDLVARTELDPGRLVTPLVDAELAPSAAPDDGPTSVEGARDDASGLLVDLPVVAVGDVDLAIIAPDGSETITPFYERGGEASLSDVAVRPGSTTDDLVVAVVSASEGETSIRTARFVDGVRTDAPTVVAVAQGEVTGLEWAEDGSAVAWSDGDGLHAVDRIDGSDEPLGGDVVDLGTSTDAIVDWVWTDQFEDGLVGVVTLRSALADGRTGMRTVAITRDGDGTLLVDSPSPARAGVEIDSHANPFAAVGPAWGFVVVDGEVIVTLAGDGDLSATVARVPVTRIPVRFEAGGGVAIVVADSATDDGVQRVTADGQVTELPIWNGYDVLD